MLQRVSGLVQRFRPDVRLEPINNHRWSVPVVDPDRSDPDGPGCRGDGAGRLPTELQAIRTIGDWSEVAELVRVGDGADWGW